MLLGARARIRIQLQLSRKLVLQIETRDRAIKERENSEQIDESNSEQIYGGQPSHNIQIAYMLFYTCTSYTIYNHHLTD